MMKLISLSRAFPVAVGEILENRLLLICETDRRRSIAAVSIVFMFALAGGAWAAQPYGQYLPQTSLFELTRRSDMIVLARPSKGDVVRVIQVVGRKNGPKSMTVAHFGALRVGLLQPATKNYKAQSYKEFDQVLLFLQRRGDVWWICETIPRARAANGCVWVRKGQVYWYGRSPWPYGPRLVERDPATAKPGRAYREKTTIEDLLKLVRGWHADLSRLRAMDEMTSQIQQRRAMRAFVHPSTQPSHSPEAIALVKRLYREAGRNLYGAGDDEKTEPPRSAWELVRGELSDVAVSALAKTESKDPREREAALKQIHAMALPEITQSSLKALKDPDKQVRLAAAAALADFADASCSATLIAGYRAIKDPRDPMRTHLSVAMANTDEPAAVAELILALQDISESNHYTREVADLLAWRFRYEPKSRNREEYTSARWWASLYEKRYGRKVTLRPWTLARLEAVMKRSPVLLRQFPPAELKLIPSGTIDEILQRCPKMPTRTRAPWCELIFRAWDAGAVNDAQKRTTLDTFGSAKSVIRAAYPVGSMARIAVNSAWPQPIALPRTMRATSKSQLFVNGAATGRPYPIRDLRIYLSPFSPGDFGPGEHRYRIETTYEIRAGKSTFSHTVKSAEQRFEVVMPGKPYGLDAKTDPALDARVERAFVFIADDGSSPSATAKSPRSRRQSRYPSSDGGYVEFQSGNRWELTEALPVDLAFDVEYELVDFGVILDGYTLYIPQGQTRGDLFNPYYFRSRMTKLQEPGTYHFRVRLAPSRDVALANLKSRAYWDGYILEGPEMKFQVVKIPPAKKK